MRRAETRPLSQVLLVVLLLIVPATLPALAHASPPDPSWIPGIYDDADYDDVVTLIVSGTGNIFPVALADLEPILRLVQNLTQFAERAPESLYAFAGHSRAPPAS